MMAPGPDTGSCIVKIPFPVEIMQFRSPKVPAIGQIVREPYGFAPGMPEVGNVLCLPDGKMVVRMPGTGEPASPDNSPDKCGFIQ